MENDTLTICEQRKGAIDLMVTDVMMPGMNSIDLVDCATGRWPSIKVLFTTGFAYGCRHVSQDIEPSTPVQALYCDQLTGKVQALLSDQ